MKAEHTQDGPWVDAGLTGPDPRIVGGPLRLVKCNSVVIAFLPAWLDDEHEEARANARLIVASPQLLEALKACAAVCAGDTMHKQGLIDALTKARTAIAAATGSTHE